jgi:exosortase K
LGGVELAPESGAGFISHTHRMVVGPACAGETFFVIAFLALFLSYQGRFHGGKARLGWLGQSLVLAYLATLFTNAIRILIAAHLYDLDIYGGWFTPERLHRLAGTAIYCAALFALCSVVERWVTRVAATRSPWLTYVIPFMGYLGIAVGIPLLHGAYRRDLPRFIEHSTSVVVICTVTALIATLAKLNGDRLQSRERKG